MLVMRCDKARIVRNYGNCPTDGDKIPCISGNTVGSIKAVTTK